jgi:hypothetical protein
VSTLAAASLAIILFAAACLVFALWSGQLPWLNVVTGAKPVGPAGIPADTARTALPWLDDPKSPGARIAALDPQQARRDYRASQAAGYVEELADWDLRRAVLGAHMTEADAAAGLLDTTVPAPRKEQ